MSLFEICSVNEKTDFSNNDSRNNNSRANSFIASSSRRNFEKKKKKEKEKKRDRRTIDDATRAPNPLSQTFLVNGTLGWLLAHRLSHPPNKKSSCGDKRVARRRTFAAIFHGKGDRGQIRCAFLSIIISYSSRNFVNIFWLGRYFHLWRISFLVHDSSWQYLKTFIAEKFN